MRAAASRLVLSRTVKGSGVMTSATLSAHAHTPHALHISCQNARCSAPTPNHPIKNAPTLFTELFFFSKISSVWMLAHIPLIAGHMHTRVAERPRQQSSAHRCAHSRR